MATTKKYKGNYPTVFKRVDPVNTKINSFRTFKQFTFLSGSVTSSALPLEARYIDRTNLPALGSELTYNDAANIDGSLQSVTYFSIDHLYYKNKTQPYNVFGPDDIDRTKRFLFQSASIFVIPQNKIGEGIKPASFSFTGSGLNLSADRYGNIIDDGISTDSIVTDVQFYEGFNEYFDTSRISFISESGVTYLSGVPTTDGDTAAVGLRAHFEGSGHIQTEIPGYYDRQHDFAISFFISGSNTTLNNQIIIAKQEQSKNTYPFSIQLSGSNEIEFKVSSNSSLNATLATTSSVDEWTHIICQKTGSELQIWMDAGLQVSSSHDFLLNNVNSLYTASGRIDNNVPLNIGGFSPNTSNLTGDLDEIRIFNKSLTESEISALSGRTENGTFLQTNHVGNVFGKHGTIVISSPHYKYENLTTTSYTASYRSTLTIQEHSTLVNVAAGDFNLSLNPSLEQETGEEFKLFTTGSDFTPYITTIGLYNDQGQLLVIGKLAQPIRKRNDVDMNFLIRFDTDI
jgi:hypothetical protein